MENNILLKYIKSMFKYLNLFKKKYIDNNQLLSDFFK